MVYSRLEVFLDQTIDDINHALNSNFPVFSSLGDGLDYSGETDYDYFPDEYVRTVVCKGAAHKFYVMDEEGTAIAEKYEMDYNNALFLMARDYMEKVPEEYASDNTGSMLYDETALNYQTPFDFEVWS